MVDFTSEKRLLKAFLLMAFAVVDDPKKGKSKHRTYDLVGVEEGRLNRLLGYKARVGEEGYDHDPELRYDHHEEIHLVVPCAFLKNQATGYLLVSRRGRREFSNHIYFPAEGKEKEELLDIGKSASIPLLYADPETLHPVLLVQRSSTRIESVRIKSKSKDIPPESEVMAPEYGPLSSDHSSASVDVVGDLKSDLVLMVGEGGQRKLRILRNLPTGFKQIHEMKLPGTMGPMIFGDFRRTGMNDMAFVCEENGKHLLRIYYNRNSRDCVQLVDNSRFDTNDKFVPEIYTDSDMFEADLKEVVGSRRPVFDTGDAYGKIPCGIFAADPHANNKLTFFLTMLEEGSGNEKERRVVVALSPVVKDGRIEELVVPEGFTDISKLRGVYSVACADYNNTGREAVLVNRLLNNEVSLFAFKNELSKENLKLSLTSIFPMAEKEAKCYNCEVLGVSYMISYSIYEKVNIIGSQQSQSSFLHLRHPTAYLGLSQNNYIVDNLIIGAPGRGKFNALYIISSAVIPNTDLIFYLKEGGKCLVESHFILGPHFRRILTVLGTVGVVNLIVVLLFHSRDRMKRTSSRSASNMHPLFSTLS
jgi:integrin alpha FG-GAP repeat containing protein 1